MLCTASKNVEKFFVPNQPVNDVIMPEVGRCLLRECVRTAPVKVPGPREGQGRTICSGLPAATEITWELDWDPK